jgi:dihydrolipoamide dehydrogenase
LQRLKVDLIHGHGGFLDDRTLQVIDEHGVKSTVTADNIIVATGSTPDFQDSSRPRMVNSDELLRTSTLPERLVIIGAGYIGCEFASIYRTLGSEVTLIEKANQDWLLHLRTFTQGVLGRCSGASALPGLGNRATARIY